MRQRAKCLGAVMLVGAACRPAGPVDAAPEGQAVEVDGKSVPAPGPFRRAAVAKVQRRIR